MKPDIVFWCGIVAAANPQRAGGHPLHLQLQQHRLLAWCGCVIKRRGQVVGSSRKVSEEPCLFDIYL